MTDEGYNTLMTLERGLERLEMNNLLEKFTQQMKIEEDDGGKTLHFGTRVQMHVTEASDMIFICGPSGGGVVTRDQILGAAPLVTEILNNK